MTKSLDDFREDLGQIESSGRYNVENPFGYIGKYQMGEYAMIDAGYYKKEGKINNKWDGIFTGKDGVYSKQDFLNNPKAQENALNIYKKIQWQYLKPYHKYVGQTIKGIKITPSGMLAGAHNGGHGGVIEYIKSNGEKDPTDGNGVHVSKYMKKFQDYDVFEWTGMKYSHEDDSNNLNNKSEPIKDVNNDIKKKHDEKEGLNKSSKNIDNFYKILAPEDKALLQNFSAIYNLADKYFGQQIKIKYLLPAVINTVSQMNNLPSSVVTQFLQKTIKLYKDNFSNPKSNSSSSTNGHWVTIRGNHVFIEDK